MIAFLYSFLDFIFNPYSLLYMHHNPSTKPRAHDLHKSVLPMYYVLYYDYV